jgi:phage head maturation protease
MKKFIVSDSSVNSYGFRVLSEGGKVDRFKQNPVMLWNHQRDDVFQPNAYTGPIGIWNDLQLEGDNWTAVPEFDTEDQVGASVARKVDKGFLRAASVGIKVLSVSDKPELKLPGQTMPTITEWELLEISVCDIPANQNAVALYDDSGKMIELKNTDLHVALSAFNKDEKPIINNNMKLKIMKAWVALSLFLGITHEDQVEGTEAEITPEQLSAIDADLAQLAAVRATNDSLVTELGAMKDEILSLGAQLKASNDKVVELETKLGMKPAAVASVVANNPAVVAGPESDRKPLGSHVIEHALRLKAEREGGC